MAAQRIYGNQCAVFSADGVDLIGTFQNVGLTLEKASVDGRTVAEVDSFAIGDRFTASIDFSRVVESTLGLLTIALSTDPNLTIILRHCITGDSVTGTFVITSARWSCTAGQLQTESITAVSQGTVAISAPVAIAAPVPGGTPANRLTGANLLSLSIDAVDQINLYTDMTVDVALETADASAAKDAWTYTRAISRKVTLTASRLVEADLSGASATVLKWNNALVAGTAVNISIGNNNAATDTLTGAGLITNARLEIGNGPQKESITVESRGAFALA